MTSDSAKPIKQPDSDRPKPINDARLAALEELSAMDQELELKYGLTGNPMIKAQERKQPTAERLGEIAADMPRWKTLTLLEQLRDKGPAMKCVPMFAVKAMRHAASMIESHQQHDAELETACHQSELDYQAEIERLRLTDAEQSLIRRLAAACEGGHPREWTNRALTADDRATLRGLLERIGGER